MSNRIKLKKPHKVVEEEGVEEVEQHEASIKTKGGSKFASAKKSKGHMSGNFSGKSSKVFSKKKT